MLKNRGGETVAKSGQYETRGPQWGGGPERASPNGKPFLPTPERSGDCKPGGDRLHRRTVAGFRHKGLGLLYEKGDRRLVPADHADKIERILERLNEAKEPGDMRLPGFRLHQLKGNLAGFWSVSVSGNWRIIFQFDGSNAHNIDLIDYH